MKYRVISAGLVLVAFLLAGALAWTLSDRQNLTEDKAADQSEIASLEDRIDELQAQIDSVIAALAIANERLASLGGDQVTPLTVSVPVPESSPSSVPPVTNPAGQSPPGQQKRCVVNLLGVCI